MGVTLRRSEIPDDLISFFESVRGAEMSSVLTFPTRPFSGGHYAAFPPRLPELCIRASTSERGTCPRCGKQYARVIDKGLTAHDGDTESAYPVGSTANRLALLRQAARERGQEYANETKTLDWKPTCQCAAGPPIPARVLDPFSGAGTSALVCEELHRDSINIDISAEYNQLAKDRLVAAEQKRIERMLKEAKTKSRSRGLTNGQRCDTVKIAPKDCDT